MEVKEANVFETQNVDLATFLVYEGIRLIECVKDQSNRRIVIMRFYDPHEKCIDLERVYLSSDFKKFRDINKYLLSKVHQKSKE